MPHFDGELSLQEPFRTTWTIQDMPLAISAVNSKVEKLQRRYIGSLNCVCRPNISETTIISLSKVEDWVGGLLFGTDLLKLKYNPVAASPTFGIAAPRGSPSSNAPLTGETPRQAVLPHFLTGDMSCDVLPRS